MARSRHYLLAPAPPVLFPVARPAAEGTSGGIALILGVDPSADEAGGWPTLLGNAASSNRTVKQSALVKVLILSDAVADWSHQYLNLAMLLRPSD